MRRARRNPSLGYVNCDGFDAVMEFIAKTNGDDVPLLWLRLAQAAAPDHGFKPPRASKTMDCAWLLKKLQATTPEAQWDLVSRVEPLFHSAWQESVAATNMLECASLLYAPRQGSPRIVNDEVRLAACDVAETALRYTDDPRAAAAIEVSRRYAIGQANAEELNTAILEVMAAARTAARAVADNAAAYTAALNTALGAVENAAGAAASAVAWDADDSADWDKAKNANWDETLNAAEARNADIVRKSLGTPGLALLMREPELQSFLLPSKPRRRA